MPHVFGKDVHTIRLDKFSVEFAPHAVPALLTPVPEFCRS
jgi:hypothetical protein